VITGGGGSDGAERLDDAAAAVNGFEGVALDAEAQAAIAAALEACAERARAAEAALDEGGEAAVDATLALGAEFVRVAENGHPYRGTLEAPVAHEDFVPFAPGEERWQLAGADTPEALVRFEEEVEALGRGRGC
jgi:hypothetical protein